MYKVKCKEKGCNKEIEGYTKEHAEALLEQHMIKHKNERRKEDAKSKKDK
jgi:hypothetical protein